jgi:hypothetical protein
MTAIKNLRDGQWMTPEWAALELVERHFSHLNSGDLVLEPSAGLGAFLQAIPPHVPAIGVEIDPELASECTARTGREVILGDFSMVTLPQGITAMIGNPPFHVPTIERFIRRAGLLLPKGGQCGMILPAYAVQTHQRVMGWHKLFSMSAEILPRRLFPRLRLPLVFVVFTREDQRKMVSFALYREACEVDNLAPAARRIIEQGRPHRSVWRALVEATLQHLGGEASLPEIYSYIEPRRPTPNAWWREKVRQVLQFHRAVGARICLNLDGFQAILEVDS